MARRAPRVCSRTGCPELTYRGGRCDDCRAEAERARGTAAQRGYGTAHRKVFREAVLKRDPNCVCDDAGHGHGHPCGEPSLHADHWPTEKKDLVAKGLDSNDPKYGRGLCATCHNRWTRQTHGAWQTS